jgi:hypothetical protein
MKTHRYMVRPSNPTKKRREFATFGKYTDAQLEGLRETDENL